MATKPTDKIPGDFILSVCHKRGSDERLEMGLRDITEPEFVTVQSLISQKKNLEAVKFVITNCRTGGCEAADITGNFLALRAAMNPIMDFLDPMAGELKKS